VVVTPGRAVRAGDDVQVLDARPRRPLADPVTLERALLDRTDNAGARIVIDTLDDFVRRLGQTRTVAFFTRVCPRVFDAGAIA